MTSVPHPQADGGGRSQVLRLRERAAYPQLGWFPSFYEVDGPRHASCETVLPSNLVRPLFEIPHILLRVPVGSAEEPWDNAIWMSLDDLQAQLRGALDQQFTALKSQFEQSLAESRREADAEAERQLGEKLAAARAEFDAQVQAAQAEAERRVVEAAELASQAEQQAADARERTAVAEEQAAQAAERVTHAEQQAAQAGERATQAEQQASRAEQQSAQAFERLAHAEQRATELEQRASQAEQRIAHAERKTADAHRQVVEIATLQRQELEQQFQQLLEHHIARTSGEVRRTAELELVAEREQVRQEHDAERQRLLSERDAERQRLIEERDVERERLKRENEAERMRLQIELAVGHQQTLDEERQRLLRERDAERERLQTEREAERQRLQSEREAERQRLQSELEAEHQQAIDAERQRTKDALEAVRQRLQNDLDAERERALGAERQRMQAEFDAERRRSAEAEATRQGEIETERQRLQGEVAQAQAALAAADEQARTDLDALRMHLEGEIAVARAGAAAVVKAVSMPAAAGTGPDAGRIVGAIRALDDSTTLSETLDLLLNHTRALAGRAALFLIDGSRLKAWRGAGIPQVDVQTGESSIGGQDLLARAIQSGRAVQSGPDVPPPPFARLSAKGTALAMPVLLGGRAVAVLYADSGDGALPAGAPDLVDALLRHASTVLAVLTAQRTLDVVTGKPLNGGAVPDPNADDQSARRFARLLVSEIKLYNEAAVRDGRQHRDLLARLGPEIERARRLYEERVPGVGSRHMYFQQELVQTLADGDPSLLGNA